MRNLRRVESQTRDRMEVMSVATEDKAKVEVVRKWLFNALKKEGFTGLNNDVQTLQMDPLDEEVGEFAEFASSIFFEGLPKKLQMSLEGIVTIDFDGNSVDGQYQVILNSREEESDEIAFAFKAEFNKDGDKIAKHKFYYNVR